MFGTANGYLPTDSIAIHIYWGDGNDSVFKTPIQSWTFSGWAGHTYTTDGIYSLQYIATGPDGNADTLSNYSQFAVADTCGIVNGRVYNDLNNDCVFTNSDSALGGIPVCIKLGNSIIQWSYTSGSGNYYFSVPSGNYTVQVNNYNWYGFSPSCPSSGQVLVNTSSNPTNDFAMTCPNSFNLQGSLCGWGFRPVYPGFLYPNAFNAACMPTSGSISLTLDPLTSYAGSFYHVPANINGNVITWNFNGINAYNYWNGWNSFWDDVMIYTSPNAQIGDTVCFTVSVTPLIGDIDPTNNIFTFCSTVKTSWDPNAKDVSPMGIGAAGRVKPNTEFTYTIHFQNTGNDTAHNIGIVDTLDSDLDISTFQAIASNHKMTPEILPGNIVKFSFNNIMLPDSGTNMQGSLGYVTYRVHTKANLQSGTQIKNTGYIYFDFNPAVITNTTLNTIDAALGMNEVRNDILFEVFPNPANTNVSVKFSENTDGELSLVDVVGKIVLRQKVNTQMISVDLTSITPGVYQLLFNGEKTSSNKKIVVIH